MDNDLAQTTEQMDAFAAMAWAWAVAFLPRLAAAITLLVGGFLVAAWLARIVTRLIARSDRVDTTVIPVIGIVLRYAVLILVGIAALGQLGVQTTSLLAVLGAAGLAIGLALQGTLQNIAAGIMLLYLRPFRVEDYIETDTVAGVVKSVGLFATELDTFDGRYVFAPNSQIWNKTLVNSSRNNRRMMNIPIGISYDADPAEARRLLLDMARADDRVLKDPPAYVYVDKYGDNSVDLIFRAWAPTAIFWDVQRTMIEEAKRRLEAAGIEIPFPQRIVHVVPPPSLKSGDAPAEASAGIGGPTDRGS